MAKKTYLKQDEETIAKIHAVLIVLVNEVKRICEKHKIPYIFHPFILQIKTKHSLFNYVK